MDTKTIPLFKVFMTPTASQAVAETLNSGYIGQGQRVEDFEMLLKARFANDYTLTTNSGTSAEHLALHLLKKPHQGVKGEFGSVFYDSHWDGMSEGDEVLCTALTCTATNFPVLANGFKIKWVDVDPKNLNIDLDDLARKITRKTKAIMVVHWGGYPVDLDRLKSIQEDAVQRVGIKPVVIEDCAHAFGSTFNNRPIGSHGNTCTFSFQAIKHLTTVDGGALTLPHQELYRRAKLMRWYGIDRDSNRKDFRCEADIEEWGFKFHMNDVCATVGVENLKEVDKVLATHKENAAYYDQQLKGVNGVTLLERDRRMCSTFWIYSLLVEGKGDFMRYMAEKGVAVSQVHERNDIHSCLREFRTLLPNLDTVTPKLISIPVGWWVTPEDREYIVECIKRGW
jgi:dTDP-4-amino-4,6-dideoxygalactose transaminase